MTLGEAQDRLAASGQEEKKKMEKQEGAEEKMEKQEGAEEKMENGSQKGSAAGDGEQSLSSSTAAGHFDGKVKSSVKTIDKEAAPSGGEHKLESAILALDVPRVFT